MVVAAEGSSLLMASVFLSAVGSDVMAGSSKEEAAGAGILKVMYAVIT